MKLKSILIAVVLVAVGLVMITACNSTSQSSDCKSSFSEPGSYENVCLMEVGEKTTTTTIRMQVDLDAGAMDWQLADPRGEIIWESNAAAGKPVDVTQTYAEPVAGKWKLTITTHDAQGSYDVGWNGR